MIMMLVLTDMERVWGVKKCIGGSLNQHNHEKNVQQQLLPMQATPPLSINARHVH